MCANHTIHLLSMATHIRNIQFWRSKPSRTLPNSIVVITGAGSGIGQNVAYIYAQRYVNLVLVDINTDSLNATKLSCVEYGARSVLCVPCDVTQYKQCQNVLEQIELQHQTKSIDILILCAGINSHHLFSRTTDLAVYHKLMNINFYGYLYMTHIFYNSLCHTNGILIAITSFSGEVGLPYRTAYCASKFAITGFLESLRAEMSYIDNDSTQNSNTNSNDTINKPVKQQKFDICIICPPTVDTQLRHNSLKVDPLITESEPSKYSMTVQQCALAIVDAGDRRLRKAFFPATSFFANYLRPLLPDQIDKLIMKRAKL